MVEVDHAWKLATLSHQTKLMSQGSMFDLLLADYPKFQAIYNNVSKDGAKLVLLLRLSPLVPFNLLNYGLGGYCW